MSLLATAGAGVGGTAGAAARGAAFLPGALARERRIVFRAPADFLPAAFLPRAVFADVLLVFFADVLPAFFVPAFFVDFRAALRPVLRALFFAREPAAFRRAVLPLLPAFFVLLRVALRAFATFGSSPQRSCLVCGGALNRRTIGAFDAPTPCTAPGSRSTSLTARILHE